MIKDGYPLVISAFNASRIGIPSPDVLVHVVQTLSGKSLVGQRSDPPKLPNV